MTQYEQVEKDAKIKLKEIDVELNAAKKDLAKAEQDESDGLTMA